MSLIRLGVVSLTEFVVDIPGLLSTRRSEDGGQTTDQDALMPALTFSCDPSSLADPTREGILDPGSGALLASNMLYRAPDGS